ncbi:phage antirepressor N-terminal domain-containing protein [Pseudomonas linyingensis]|nr:phage antirepressor N-terminal domain-containing protein [Pseudomonas linyingensis]
MSKNITAAAQVIPFRKAELLLIDHVGEPFVPMKPVVEGMGLAWSGQHEKLSSGRFQATIKEIVIVAGDSKQRAMTCLPLRKLTGWLMSISPNKVKPELRDGIIAYQNECDDVLWSYWNEGRAVRNDDRTIDTVLNTTIGTDGFRCLAAVVEGKARVLPAPVRRQAKAKLWAQVHAAFSVRRAEDIPAAQLDAARNFVAAYALEGEWLPKVKEEEFVLGFYEAQEVCHLVHHAIWCVYRWDSSIAAGVKAMNYPVWLDAFEHFQEARRSARRIEHMMPQILDHFRGKHGGLLPEDCAARCVAA